MMFKHFLLPTDGSAMSTAIIRKCIGFARQSGATVTAVHVIRPFHIFTPKAEMLEATSEEYAQDSMANARGYLAEVEEVARDAGVLCKTLVYTGEHPYEVIINTAREQGCDLICMASHGRSGVKGLLLGSETQKVLTHSQTPVLVFR